MNEPLIFDSHAHYTDPAFDPDREQVLAALPEQGVARVMLAASDLASALAGIQLAAQYDYIYTSVGTHPEEAGRVPADYLETLEQLLACRKVHAIGEIGLDYHYPGYDPAQQKTLFCSQLELAAKHDLPVIMHCRDATGDCMEILRQYRPKGVMHCFSGSAETARELVAMGLYVGFTGVVTFKNARRALEAVRAVPMDRLLVETDCPYMAPVPYRGKRCDSSMIPMTAGRMAEEKGCTLEEMLRQTGENAKRLFSVK